MAQKRLPPFAFVLQELEEAGLAPRLRTRPMFGSHAVYLDEKIIFILRKKDDATTSRDNGVWVAALPENEVSLKREFPSARLIEMFQLPGRRVFSGWLNLPENEDGFEAAVLQACRLVIKGDSRIGKFPKSRTSRRRS